MAVRHHIARRRRAGGPRGTEAMAELAAAYRDVFGGNAAPTLAQKEAVLTDLANASGFYRVNGPDIRPEARAFADGARSVYGRVFRFLRMSADEVRDLEEAARQEAITDAQHGEI